MAIDINPKANRHVATAIKRMRALLSARVLSSANVLIMGGS